MFWKFVNSLRLKSVSMVTKLMVFYSLSTIGLMTAICLFLYPTFLKMMEQINGGQPTHLTTECYKKMIITLLLASLASILFGHFIARKGLNKLQEFENKMDNITADSLHERIDLNEWPKELNNLGNKFNTMLDRLESSFLQLSQFSSDIAHELRTPINNLRGVTELALIREQSLDEYQNVLLTCMSEYQHLSKLIENLLFIARSDHGQIMLNKVSINAQDEILKICDYYKALADEKDITLSCTGHVTVQADSTLFKRVISNILSNALKYTQLSGNIMIDMKSVNQFAQVTIRDTGVGILSEHLPKIFDRFYRIDASRSPQTGGVGLGLSIVKSIIDLHHGKINIESNVDVGTAVHIQFPI